MIEVFIRQPQSQEIGSARSGVQTVMNEVYGGVSAPLPLLVNEKAGSSWVTVVDEKIIGAVLTSAEWLDDLGVLRDPHGCGIGKRLLAQAEAEIVARGHETLRPRFVHRMRH